MQAKNYFELNLTDAELRVISCTQERNRIFTEVNSPYSGPVFARLLAMMSDRTASMLT